MDSISRSANAFCHGERGAVREIPVAPWPPVHREKKACTKRHDAWLRTQTWPIAALDQTQRAYLRAVDEAVARLRAVEDDLRVVVHDHDRIYSDGVDLILPRWD